jgi:hypothetical protein
MTDFSPPPVDAFVVTSRECAAGDCVGCDGDPIMIGPAAYPCSCRCHVLVEVTCGEPSCDFRMMVRPLGPVIAVNHGQGPDPMSGVWHGLVNCLDPGLRSTPAPDEDTAEDRLPVEVPTGPRLVGVDELEVSASVMHRASSSRNADPLCGDDGDSTTDNAEVTCVVCLEEDARVWRRADDAGLPAGGPVHLADEDDSLRPVCQAPMTSRVMRALNPDYVSCPACLASMAREAEVSD